jgi:hypothetical protein
VARGWESKSVEAQIEEGENRPAPTPRGAVTPEGKLRRQRLESLKLSRSRLMQQLEVASNPSYRNVLMKGLQAVEKEMEQISAEEDSA